MDVGSVSLSPQPVTKPVSPQKKNGAFSQFEPSASKRNEMPNHIDVLSKQPDVVSKQPEMGLDAARNDQEPQTEVMDEESVQNVVDMMNEFMEDFNTSIHFSVHKDTSRLMMTVVNQTTGDVLKEIPTEEMLDLVAKIQDRVGILLDKKV